VVKVRKGRIHKRRREQAGNISEFAACLLVFFLFALFPLINLIFFACNCASVILITRDGAAAASTAPTYTKALAAMQTTVSKDLTGGIGKFSKLAPIGGYLSSGVDLYIVATPIGGGASTVSTADTVLGAAANTSLNIYEYRVVSKFTLQPFFPMASVPLLSAIPVVGASTPFTFTAERAVEDATGLGN